MAFQLNKKNVLTSCTYYEYTHQTHAKVIYLQTKSELNHFTLALETLPYDDTGIFHILEHSVFEGSDTYPIKNLIMELHKRSLSDNLNAYTAEEHTAYVFSTKNLKDYNNLMSVYLDFVYHPHFLNNKMIFEQEGWHLECHNLEDDIIINGIVYNEEKGALESINRQIHSHIKKLLYPDNTSGCDSGGDPKYIPELTYEQFVDTYHKFYHPSNTIIILEGQLPIEDILSKIDTLFNEYTYQEPVSYIKQEILDKKDIIQTYPVQNDTDTYYILTKIFDREFDPVNNLAMIILSIYLTGFIDAPLTKHLLSLNLVKNIRIDYYTGIRQPYIAYVLTGIDEDNIPTIRQEIQSCILDIKNHLDIDKVLSTIDYIEFTKKDLDINQSLRYQIMTAYLNDYPIDTFIDGKNTYKLLRDDINTNYYQDLIDEFLLDNMSSIILKPGDIEISEPVIEGNKEEVIKSTLEREKWLHTPVSKELIETLPHVTIDDIDTIKAPKTTRHIYKGHTIYLHSADKNDITHFRLYFKISVDNEQELMDYSIISTLMGALPTNRPYFELVYDQLKIGNINFFTEVTGDYIKNNQAYFYYVVECDVLNHRIDDALSLIKEILFETNINDFNILQQQFSQLEDQFKNEILSYGHRYVTTRAYSSLSKASLADEYQNGVSFYLNLKHYVDHFEDIDTFINHYHKFLKDINLSNITYSITSDLDYKEIVNKIEHIIPDGKENTGVGELQPLQDNTGIIIPSSVNHFCLCIKLSDYDIPVTGHYEVLYTYISTGYLWKVLRTQIGAYGAYMFGGLTGTIVFESIRNPDYIESIQAILNMIPIIKESLDNTDNIDQYIITAVNKFDAIKSSKDACYSDTINSMMHLSYYHRKQYRQEILSTTKQDLYNCLDQIEKVLPHLHKAVLGNKEFIEKDNNINEIIEIG